MSRRFNLRPFILAAAALLAGACATPQPYDYTAFKEARPKSLLVLPPLNNSPDVNASYSFLSHVTLPLAESGYYVLPVTLVDEMFRENGVTDPGQMHEVPAAKLKEIFGADAVLYIKIGQYGTSYSVISSESRVSAEASLVDLTSGGVLWQGSATASSAEGRSSSGGLVGMLVQAIVSQIVETISDRSHPVAGVTSMRLLSAGRPGGLLFGPRSPRFGTD
ncbi:DUF799 domain-containing protein [Thauera phenylacetica]|jgi:hypothetical protein|uniref:Putative lipoprotein n=1 Tax=Thauera phenylacetica B4P TaxID=1234382 RepID=N6Z1P9_9RHOO|nr:DUF799 domain-containing protein [Thauera phenylacetica]ENO97795.1 putative lipoprotein [Thauera phenylacetica B4P]HRM69049.1 DUF799 domain-containing protein [Thauera phenylacetica]